jgi:hypothetical protein
MGAHVITVLPCSQNGIFTRFVPVSRSRCFLFSGLVDPILVLHIAAWCHQAPQLIVSPQPGDKNLQVPSNLGDNSLCDRLLTGSIWFYLFFGECLGGGIPLTSLKMRYSSLIS